MTFRIKIISPIQVDEADLQRRQVRYGRQVGPDTQIEVFNLGKGPKALSTPGDVLFSAYAVFQEGVRTRPDDFDALLVDCALDPAIDVIQEHSGLPTFGATRTTLPLIPLVARNFSIVARVERQCRMLADLVKRYGYGDYLVSTRALGITYPQAKQPDVFNEVMCRQLRCVIEQDGARAVMMGSTTMALSDEIVAAADGTPLFLPGMVAVRVMEMMWSQGLLVQPGAL